MNPIHKSIYLFIAALLSTDISAEEINNTDYSGVNLAYVIFPALPQPEEDSSKIRIIPGFNSSIPVKQATQPAPDTPPKAAVTPLPAQIPKSITTESPVTTSAATPATQLVMVTTTKPAQRPSARSRHVLEWVIGLGYDFGGEELGKLTYADGSSASIKANNGIAINAGAILANGNTAFSTQITLGYKYGGQRGTNGDVTWSAIPLDVIEYFRLKNLRMGLGLSYQISPQLNVNLPSGYTDKYNNAFGLIAQFGWAPIGAHYSIDLRYTSIRYQLSEVPDAAMVDGSVAGLYTSLRF